MKEKLGMLCIILLIAIPLIISARVDATAVPDPPDGTPPPVATPSGRVATEAQLAQARTEWSRSAHADTYDQGMGANTTCARCKSPFNWDPSQEVAQQAALDCASCKREPGAPRPALPRRVPVPREEWRDITCDVCHIPVGNSYDVDIAFWNQASGQYEAVATVDELCARCHEGRHGFRVVEEQEASQVHQGMDCTGCHGAHGKPSACSDCHDPTSGGGAQEHVRHPSVTCTACHDAGGLSIWQDPNPGSEHYGRYITRRFAHTLTSWPSHNLSSEVDCVRCHHPPELATSSVVPYVSCSTCHPEGASLFWCINFEQNPNPNAGTEQEDYQTR